jgi:hypothetical protein
MGIVLSCLVMYNDTIMEGIVKMRDFTDSEWSTPFSIQSGGGIPSPASWVGKKVPSFGEVTRIYGNVVEFEDYAQSPNYVQEPYNENPDPKILRRLSSTAFLAAAPGTTRCA